MHELYDVDMHGNLATLRRETLRGWISGPVPEPYRGMCLNEMKRRRRSKQPCVSDPAEPATQPALQSAHQQPVQAAARPAAAQHRLASTHTGGHSATAPERIRSGSAIWCWCKARPPSTLGGDRGDARDSASRCRSLRNGGRIGRSHARQERS